MTSVIDLRSFAMQRLNELPPHSRKRAPLEAIAKEITTIQLGAEVAAMFTAMKRVEHETCEEIEHYGRTLNDPTMGLAL